LPFLEFVAAISWQTTADVCGSIATFGIARSGAARLPFRPTLCRATQPSELPAVIPCTGPGEKRLLRADPEAGHCEDCALTAVADAGVPLNAAFDFGLSNVCG
jgi:hypothetical protein